MPINIVGNWWQNGSPARKSQCQTTILSKTKDRVLPLKNRLIILSGGGADGLNGVKRIAENGDYIIIQTPESAEVSGMPESVATFSHSAVVALPHQLPRKLLEWVKQNQSKRQ
jgi:hypothetical protein